MLLNLDFGVVNSVLILQFFLMIVSVGCLCMNNALNKEGELLAAIFYDFIKLGALDKKFETDFCFQLGGHLEELIECLFELII
ncbi:hypothetical protein RIF29_39670 [Crotalaria pallida]|uniref:Uncharacterized protein n=1 Tax=Crotalaria pallida TaxID=3830 RepID=A0AAN9E437_CROPI